MLSSVFGKKPSEDSNLEPELDKLKAELEPIKAIIDKRNYYGKYVDGKATDARDNEYHNKVDAINNSDECRGGDGNSDIARQKICENRLDELFKKKILDIRRILKDKGVPETEVSGLMTKIPELKRQKDTLDQEYTKLKNEYEKRKNAMILYLLPSKSEELLTNYKGKSNPIDKLRDELNGLIKRINRLKTIYDESPPPTSPPPTSPPPTSQPSQTQPPTSTPTSTNPTGGSKKKTRRNRKSNKSRKNRRKSKRRY